MNTRTISAVEEKEDEEGYGGQWGEGRERNGRRVFSDELSRLAVWKLAYKVERR